MTRKWSPLRALRASKMLRAHMDVMTAFDSAREADTSTRSPG